MKTKDIIIAPDKQPVGISKTADNPNGLAHEQAQMDVAMAEVQEDLIALHKRFIELRDTYARLKMRRDQSTTEGTPSRTTQAEALAGARGGRRPPR